MPNDMYEEDYEDEIDQTEEPEEEDDGDEAEDSGQDDLTDLADAFARVREMDAEDADEAVEDPGDGSEADEQDDGEEPGGDEDVDAADDDIEYPADGGSADVPEPADYDNAERAIVTQLQRSSMAQAREQFRKNGIREFTMNDLYERSQDGRVIYHNPDDPNRPFSNRIEAQQWIDSFNGQVKQELQRVASEIMENDAKAAMPAIRLLRFAPTYDAMDAKTREIFDDLIEDYELKNRKGAVIGYNCDLERMAARAQKMATKYNTTPRKSGGSATMKKKGPQKQPSMDIRSHGSGSSKKADREPSTLGEAMRLWNEQNRAKK